MSKDDRNNNNNNNNEGNYTMDNTTKTKKPRAKKTTKPDTTISTTTEASVTTMKTEPKKGEPVTWHDGSVFLPTAEGTYMSQSHITWGQYLRFCDETGYPKPAMPDFFNPTELVSNVFLDHPVVNVSFDDSAAYAFWAEGELPTEAQWKYGAIGENDWKYPWGNKEPTKEDEFLNCRDFGPGRTTPVGSYPNGKSPFGLFDMAGQVWTWCRVEGDKPFLPTEYKQTRARDTSAEHGISVPQWFEDMFTASAAKKSKKATP